LRWLLLFIVIFSSASGCAFPSGATMPTASAVPRQTEEGTATSVPVITPTKPAHQPSSTVTEIPATFEPTATARLLDNMTIEPPPTETDVPAPNTLENDLSISEEDILLYPVPALYEGDLVTIQVLPQVPRSIAPNDVDVRILLDDNPLVDANLNWRNLNGESSGLYQWIWNTTSQPGEHNLTVILDPNELIQMGDENPDNNQVTVVASVTPRSELTEIEAEASWVVAASECCVLHVISGTAAHRDLPQLIDHVDDAFRQASAKLKEPLASPYNIYFVDRVLGQGGYAVNSIVISYLDRDYTGGGLYEVLVHEAVHLLDQQFATGRTTFLSEGLAVWVAGGHYHQEDLDQHMAALVELDDYLPIHKVIDNFNIVQHETAYLEAAGLINYLIETYGWDRVKAFYSDASPADAATQSAAIDLHLKSHFGSSLVQVEEDWLAYLKEQPRDLNANLNLQKTLRYYDVMREYQLEYDPTAYYLYAWLPEPEEAEILGATADFRRHPDFTTNIVLESMLQSASVALFRGDYELVDALLDSVQRVLNNNGQFLDPLANSYLEIVLAVEEVGYEVQQIGLQGNEATVLANQPNKQDLTQLRFIQNGNQSWILSH
jgi:hypothetical protein